MHSARLFVALSLTLVVPASLAGERSTLTEFASGSQWKVSTAWPTAGESDKWVIGHAQPVCLNEWSPSNCPAGATVYGHDGVWSADLSAIPEAQWIWAPGVAGQTPNADLAHYFFSRSFVLSGRPAFARIAIGADDFAVIWVNGVEVASVGSIDSTDGTNGGHAELRTFEFTRYLKPGRNVIVVEAWNGPSWFAGGCGGSCSYAENPAGVVFGGVLATK